MPGLGFQEQTSASRGGGLSARDSSPDFVMFTLESNFCSLFSSASASVDRCSFASNTHDRDSLASEISLHLAGLEHGDPRESSSGPNLDPDPNKPVAHITTTTNKHSRFLRNGENVKVQKEDSDANFEDENRSLDSARNSSSLALKECQDQRSRSKAISTKSDR